MIFEHSSKNKKILLITSLIILVLGIFIFFYSPIIFQEGNPWPQIKGIAKLIFGNEDIIKLDIGDNKYITKSNNLGIIKSFMKDKGYEFTEQMGSGYFFESQTGVGAVVVHRYYSRYYSLWSITENLIKKETTLADELKECLPKSDMASYEKCNDLLARIRNFNDCVTAGFPIMKSDPLQCATPDGQNFINEANSDWNIVLTALNNCEVKSIFQTHDKLITLKLKNDDKIIAYEPQIDDIFKAVENLNDRCGNIRMATE